MNKLLNTCLLIWFFIPSFYCRPSVKWQDTKFKLQRRKYDVFSDVPIWTLDSEGLHYEGFFGKNHLICQDPVTGATFMPIHECSDLESCDLKHYTGVFGTEVTQSIVNLGEEHCHEVIKRETPNKEYFDRSDGVEKFDSNNITYITQRSGIYAYKDIKHDDKHVHRFIRSVENVNISSIEIKIFVVIDYALYKILGKDYEYIAQYMNLFWSAIDLKFRMIDYPLVHLKVVGIIIAKEEKILKYIDNNPFYDYKKNTLDMSAALDGFHEIKAYLNNTMPKYDVIITISGLRGYYDYDECFGIAFRKSVCDEIGNGAIINDDGEYFGINNGVHEVGHLLGLRHDGYGSESDDEYEDDVDDIKNSNDYHDNNDYDDNDIGYKECKDREEGHHPIMNPKNLGGFDKFTWSKCSLAFFHQLQRYHVHIV